MCPLRIIAIDTPGQIEVFTWSASGSIITNSLANTLPTVIYSFYLFFFFF